MNYSTVFSGHRKVTTQCKRFYVTFNGEECTDPAPIDWVTYNLQTGEMIRSATSTYLMCVLDVIVLVSRFSDSIRDRFVPRKISRNRIILSL